MWQFLYFLPLPHGHGSLRPTFSPRLRIGSAFFVSPPAFVACLGQLAAAVGARWRALVGRRADRPQRFLERLRLLHAEDRVRHLVLDAVPHGRRIPSCPPACTRLRVYPGRSRPGRSPDAGGPSCRGGSSTPSRAGQQQAALHRAASPAGSARRRRSTARRAPGRSSRPSGRRLGHVQVQRRAAPTRPAPWRPPASDSVGCPRRPLRAWRRSSPGSFVG